MPGKGTRTEYLSQYHRYKLPSATPMQPRPGGLGQDGPGYSPSTMCLSPRAHLHDTRQADVPWVPSPREDYFLFPSPLFWESPGWPPWNQGLPSGPVCRGNWSSWSAARLTPWLCEEGRPERGPDQKPTGLKATVSTLVHSVLAPPDTCWSALGIVPLSPTPGVLA